MFAKNRLTIALCAVIGALALPPATAEDTASQMPPSQQPPMMGYPGGGMPMMPPHYRGQMPMGGCAQSGQGGYPGKMRHQRHQMMQAHRQEMEQRLARIEALLQKLVDRQQ